MASIIGYLSISPSDGISAVLLFGAQYYFVGLEKNGPHVRLPRTAQCQGCSVPGEEQGVQTYYSLTLIVFISVFSSNS